MTAHSVAELRDAWRAIEAGQFARESGPADGAEVSANAWTPSPGERVVAVVGCAGGVGASTVSVALATATAAPARVVECCPPLSTGFSAAANAELGAEGGWRRGSRGAVVQERRASNEPLSPTPAPSTVEWTILDADWTVLAGPGITWLSSLLRTLDDIVLVTNATVPGLRRLELCADLLEREALGVIVGPPAKRWPRAVKLAAAGMPDRLRLIDFPLDPRLRVTGLTPEPLPPPQLKAAQHILALDRKEQS